MPATVASQHLSSCASPGWSEVNAKGKTVVYRLRGAHVRTLLTEALFHTDHQISGAPVHD